MLISKWILAALGVSAAMRHPPETVRAIRSMRAASHYNDRAASRATVVATSALSDSSRLQATLAALMTSMAPDDPA